MVSRGDRAAEVGPSVGLHLFPTAARMQPASRSIATAAAAADVADSDGWERKDTYSWLDSVSFIIIHRLHFKRPFQNEASEPVWLECPVRSSSILAVSAMEYTRKWLIGCTLRSYFLSCATWMAETWIFVSKYINELKQVWHLNTWG